MEVLHQPGDLIAGRYRIAGTLEPDGVVIAYQAQDLNSAQPVILKALSLRQMGDWEALELFEQEARILSQLHHPAIPRYLDYFEVDTPEDRIFYLVQQLVEGQSLADLVKDGWCTNESEVRQVAQQVLSILVYLHQLKPPVVHRNIKPPTLVRGNDGKIFLVNFGAVTDSDGTIFAQRSPIGGTDDYMAPEEFRGQAVPATDLYALGATLLFLLTHRWPVELRQKQFNNSLRSHIQVSEGFANWLEKILLPDLEEGFPSAKAALEALQGGTVVAKAHPVPWKALVGVGVAAIAAVSVLNSFKWTILESLGFRPSGICEATESGNLNLVRNYLQQGGNPYARDDRGRLLLPCLLNVNKGTKDLAKLVVAKLRDVNAKDSQGKTLLHLTSSAQMAEALIVAGADVKAKDKQGNTPLDQVFDEIRFQPSYSPKKQIELPHKQIDLAKLLIAKGVRSTKVNTRNPNGRTLLHKTNSKQVAQLLIAAGADVNARDNGGSTPLHYTNSKQVAELLIAAGADVNAKTKWGDSPLHLVTSKDIAKLLIDKGADVNAKTNEGDSPLDRVRYRAPCDVVELLKKHGGKETWVTLCPGEQAYGFEFTEKGTLSYQGKVLSSSSNSLTFEGGHSITPSRLIISDYSPSRNFNLLIVCEKSPEGESPGFCWHLFFVDKEKGKVKRIFAGKYGAKSWVQWSRDERYAILVGSGCGVDWLYAINLQTGESRSFKKEFSPGTIELNSFSWINDREFKVKIINHPDYPGSQKNTASPFWWRGNIEKDPVKE